MHKITIFFGSIITILFLTIAQKGHSGFLTVSQLIKEPGIGNLKVSKGIEEWNISEKGETSSDEPRTSEHKNKMKGWIIREGDQPKVEIESFKTRKNTQSQVAHEFPLNRNTKPVKNGTKHFILIVTSGSSLNVRQQPSTLSPKIGSLHNGAKVPHIKNETDEIIDGSWFHVEHSQGKFGWVSSRYSKKIIGSRSIIPQQKTLETISPNTAQINEQLKTSNSRELKVEIPIKIQELKIPSESNSKKITDLQNANETLRLANEKTSRLIEDLKRKNTVLRMKERFKTTQINEQLKTSNSRELKAAITSESNSKKITDLQNANETLRLANEKTSRLIEDLKRTNTVLRMKEHFKVKRLRELKATISLIQTELDKTKVDYAKLSEKKLSSIQELKVLSKKHSNKIENSQKTSKTPSSKNDIVPEKIIRTSLKSWLNAWQSRNVPLYLSFYSKKFKDHKKSRPKWEAYRRQSINNSSNISIKITDIKIQASNNMVIRVAFIQRFKSDTTSDIGMKELTWAKEDENWKIIKETWKPQY
ncbi:SH3 domain-containing protein [Nitrospinae bacterium]|jgi:hypothetical protein|nr:SH3 domain-containing protein [Nitrospinota bacterium]